MFTKVYWKDALERTIRTFAQSLVTTIGLNETPIFSLEWPEILGVAATFAFVTLASYIAAPPKAAPSGAPGIDERPHGDAPPEEGASADSPHAQDTGINLNQRNLSRMFKND